MTDEESRNVVDLDTVKELFAEGVPVTYLSNEKVMVAGLVCDIVPTGGDIAESAAFIVCSRYEDGVTYINSVPDQCGDCGAVVMTRRHAPVVPRRVCIACARRRGAQL